MPIDLVIAIALTASAAVVVWILCAALPAAASRRALAAIALVAWFAVIVALGATSALAPGNFGTPALGLVVALPVVAVVALAAASARLRQALLSIPMPMLIAANAVRVLGVFFLILHAQGRLPAPFAPSAGWGDIVTGALALPVAWLVARKAQGWRPILLAWNTFGLADLIAAIGLGVASAPDSPLRLFTEEPGTAMMSLLPMFLVPGYLVPILILMHLAIFARLRHPDRVAHAP
jgi:hypothetical protein